MKTLLLILLTQLAALGLHAQKINGIAKNDEGAPVNGATISLLRSKDSSIVKLAVSESNGTYNFINIATGTYFVKASFVGHKTITSSPFAVADKDVTVSELKLSKTTGDLKGVTVTATRPLIEMKADKMIVNVEGTVNSTGNTALELLRKSPGVLIDKDDNLSMNGKSGVQVFIDGRPTPLAGQDLANYLKSMQAAEIESIELITNPSAKYEAAGNAGIINIKLKKNKSFGTNGSVNAGYNIGVYSKYNGGFSLNHRNAKVNVFGNYNYNGSINENQISIQRELLDTLFNQTGLVKMKSTGHSFKAGADYFINKKSTLGVIVNGNFTEPEVSNYSRTPISNLSSKAVNRILVADNSSQLKRDNVAFNVNYTYNNPNGKSLTLNGDYSFYNINSNQYQPNIYYSANGQTILSSVIYQMIAPSNIDIYSVKADYEQNYKKGKLGYGGKIAFVNTDNDFQRYNVIASIKELDKDRSNRFKYQENINAGYINYNRAWKGVMVQVGVRAENTVSEGTSNGLKNTSSGYKGYDSSFSRSYTDLFPSAAITFNKNPKSQLSLTYSRRIDRPAYQDLNPFEFKLDEYTFQKGNINLRPQYTNSFGITHTYMYKLNTTLNYSHVKDMFVQLFDTADGSKAFVSKQNLASQNIASLNVSYPFMYKTYSLITNVNANYKMFKADFGNGRKIDLNAFGFTFFAQNSYRFAKTWTAELTAFYNAPTIQQSNIKSNGMWSADGGIQKQVLKGRATVKASVSDIFKSLKFTGTSDFAGQKTIITSRWESRQAKVSFTYRFGSNTVKAARQRNSGAEDEMRRTQGSTGIGGN